VRLLFDITAKIESHLVPKYRILIAGAVLGGLAAASALMKADPSRPEIHAGMIGYHHSTMLEGRQPAICTISIGQGERRDG
jgi:hypothetical protein